jgi:homoserine dehydrogenase
VPILFRRADLSGRDSADKLVLMTEAAFGQRLAPDDIRRAALRRSSAGQARGPTNRLEIELEGGELIRLQGQGAGRWPTTVSVMGDLHEVARHIDNTR